MTTHIRVMLDLFSGTGSVGRVFGDAGWEVVSLDKDMEADIQTDIKHWDYKAAYPKRYFKFIWASPPCTEYSKAKTVGVRNLAEANEIVKKTIEIIEYFKPEFWVIENPQTGLLRNQSFMEHLPFKDMDCCKYGKTYRKRTRLWNNISHWTPRPLCVGDCGQVVGGRHKERAQQGTVRALGIVKGFSRGQLYGVPSGLVEEIEHACHAHEDAATT